MFSFGSRTQFHGLLIFCRFVNPIIATDISITFKKFPVCLCMLCEWTYQGRTLFASLDDHDFYACNMCSHIYYISWQVLLNKSRPHHLLALTHWKSLNHQSLNQKKSLQIFYTFSRYIAAGNYYQDSIKGIICAKNNITEQFQHSDDSKIEFSIKPLFIITVTYIIFFGFILYFFSSAQKQRLFSLIYKSS